ncbi:MAG: hypothetical protein WA666_11550 [Nitrospirota bacterium]
MKNKDADAIRCSRVEISGILVCEINGGKNVLVIPREKIRNIRLVCDSSAKNPFFQFFIGLLMMSFGFLGLIAFWLASSILSTPIDVDPDVVRIPIIPIFLWIMTVWGIWNLTGVFKTHYHLLIETEDGFKQIFFEKSTKLGEIRQFLRRTCWRFGYEIDTSLKKLEEQQLCCPWPSNGPSSQ